MPRFFSSDPLRCDTDIALPAGAARHVQVLRLQPGMPVTLFDGQGGEYAATIERIGRSEVRVRVGVHDPTEREVARAVHLAIGMPANERMDWLVEKATELGAASIQPLVTERGVLRLNGERVEKKRLHWQAIATAACEQCGRNRVPALHPVRALPDWLATREQERSSPPGLLLSLRAAALMLLVQALPATGPVCCLSGAEGGFSDAEEDAAVAAGFMPVSLGPRVLRAETAALAALCALASA